MAKTQLTTRQLYKRAMQLSKHLGIGHDGPDPIADGHPQLAFIEHTVHELAHALCLRWDVCSYKYDPEELVVCSDGLSRSTSLSDRIEFALRYKSSAPKHELRSLAIGWLVIQDFKLDHTVEFYDFVRTAHEQGVIRLKDAHGVRLQEVSKSRRIRTLANKIVAIFEGDLCSKP